MAHEISVNPAELVIRHERLDLKIRLSNSDALLIHEETIPERVDELREEFVRDGIVKDPVVVDEASCVVLDGMHRVIALRELGCLRLPVCAVDYLNSSIKVGTWYRTSPAQFPIDEYQKALSSLEIELRQFPFDSNKLLEDAPLAIAFSSRECFELRNDKMRIYEILKKAEEHMLQYCPSIGFETERDALDELVNGHVHAIMTLPRIEKAEVCRAGLAARPFPHKVTRHVIPARPLAVNVALKTLINQNISSEDADRQFVESLQRRRIMRRPPGSIMGDRRYEEETFVFS